MSVRQRFGIPREHNQSWQPRAYQPKSYPDKREPFEPCSEASAAIALEAVAAMFPAHAEDAKVSVIFSAVSGWHSRKTGQWGHNAASALSFDASSRIVGRAECLAHKTPEERASLIAEAEAALAVWQSEGCPGLLQVINNRTAWLLERLEKDTQE